MVNIDHVLYAGSNKIIRKLCDTVNWLLDHGGGGGSEVIVDPIVTEGVNIADISVDQTTYRLYAPQGGGGGSYEETTLYTGSLSNPVTSIEFSDSYKNYDAIITECWFIYGGNYYQFSNLILSSMLEDVEGSTYYFTFGVTNDSVIYAKLTDETHVSGMYGAGSFRVTKVIGINY